MMRYLFAVTLAAVLLLVGAPFAGTQPAPCQTAQGTCCCTLSNGVQCCGYSSGACGTGAISGCPCAGGRG